MSFIIWKKDLNNTSHMFIDFIQQAFSICFKPTKYKVVTKIKEILTRWGRITNMKFKNVYYFNVFSVSF